VNDAYLVKAKFIPYETPKKVGIANITGDVDEATVPGYVTFTMDGQECRLEAQSEGDGLFINFKDRTNGDVTYPPGRFLDAPKPENGVVYLDFNQAYNPPCAFTAFATCPLPPPQNFLKVAIPAGEKKYHVSEEDFIPAGQKIEFAHDIAAFVQADKENPPKKGRILFIGSSIFREWTHLKEQLAPLPVFNRGFGGSRTWEVLHYADEIALPYEPRIIVYYCGSNDINVGEKPEAILERYRQFSDKVTEQLPNTRLYFVSIFRAPQKKEHWDIVDATNHLIRDYSLKTKNRGFIDANPIVFDTNGQPRTELYQPDGLHFEDATYVAFAALLKPILQEAWQGGTTSIR
jgi:lysophospholipase L1-like esterase